MNPIMQQIVKSFQSTETKHPSPKSDKTTFIEFRHKTTTPTDGSQQNFQSQTSRPWMPKWNAKIPTY